MEHRWGERVRVGIPIRLTGTQPYLVTQGRLENLSISGGFIAAKSGFRTFSRIKVLLEAPLRPKQDAPVLDAYVARQQQGGIGVEWCEFAAPAVLALLRVAARSVAASGGPMSPAARGHIRHLLKQRR